METLDSISGIIGYALVNARDGSIEEVRGASARPLGELTAFFFSAGEVIKNSLSMGEIDCVSLWYGSYRLLILPYDSTYIGVEIEGDKEPRDIIEKIRLSKKVVKKAKIDLPLSVTSKIQQINLLVDEFGGKTERSHWRNLLNQCLGILGGDIVLYVGIINDKLAFKAAPPRDKEEDFVQGLRSIIDFLIRRAVVEMGSSEARAKVQAVIEKMK